VSPEPASGGLETPQGADVLGGPGPSRTFTIPVSTPATSERTGGRAVGGPVVAPTGDPHSDWGRVVPDILAFCCELVAALAEQQERNDTSVLKEMVITPASCRGIASRSPTKENS